MGHQYRYPVLILTEWNVQCVLEGPAGPATE